MSFEQKQYWLKGQEYERERIIALLEADCNHAEPQCYHQTVIALIKGEEQ